MNRTMVRSALALVLCALPFVAPLCADPPRQTQRGPYDTESATLELRDDDRGKDLPIRVTWPDADKGPWPLIVYSHGAFGSRDNYKPLVEHWVSHGYVVVQPTHSDSLSLMDRDERIEALRGFRRNKNGVFRDWRNRPKDVSFVIDSLDEIAKRLPALKGKIDLERIGLGGHSYGAHTSQVIGGVRPVLPGGGPVDLRDKRVGCVLLISPQGRGRLLKEPSWATLAAPMMTVTGSRDKGRNGDGAMWRTEPFRFCPPGDKVLVWIEGADHGFGGIAGSVRLKGHRKNQTHVDIVRAASLTFWDAWLKEDAAAKKALSKKALEGLDESVKAKTK